MTYSDEQLWKWVEFLRAMKGVRWRILTTLIGGPRTAMTISKELSLLRRTINGHLREMERQGVVRVEKKYPYLYSLEQDVDKKIVHIFLSIFEASAPAPQLWERLQHRQVNLLLKLSRLIDAPRPMAAEVRNHIAQEFGRIELELSDLSKWVDSMAFVPRLRLVSALTQVGSMSISQLAGVQGTSREAAAEKLEPLLAAGAVRRHGFQYYAGNHRLALKRFLVEVWRMSAIEADQLLNGASLR